VKTEKWRWNRYRSHYKTKLSDQIIASRWPSNAIASCDTLPPRNQLWQQFNYSWTRPGAIKQELSYNWYCGPVRSFYEMKNHYKVSSAVFSRFLTLPHLLSCLRHDLSEIKSFNLSIMQVITKMW